MYAHDHSSAAASPGRASTTLARMRYGRLDSTDAAPGEPSGLELIERYRGICAARRPESLYRRWAYRARRPSLWKAERPRARTLRRARVATRLSRPVHRRLRQAFRSAFPRGGFRARAQLYPPD